MTVLHRHPLTTCKHLLSALFLFISVFVYSQPKVSTIDFTGNAEITTTGITKNLYVRSASGSACPNAAIKTATLEGKIDLGEDYKFGNALVYSYTVHVDIKGYMAFSGTGTAPLLNAAGDLVITSSAGNFKPEQSFSIDFSNYYNNINRFDVTVTLTNSNGAQVAIPQNKLHVNVNYKEVFSYQPSASTPLSVIALANTISDNPVTFNWNPECAGIPAPDYEFQLLRLYNIDPLKITEQNITALIDWSKALTIQTGSSDTHITLTLTEGQGYYAWRVRPIGNAYDGGIANNANWGLWSSGSLSPTTGTSGIPFTTGSASSSVFFYNQFDDNKNWEYSRTFVEGDTMDDIPVTISEQMSYSNSLQMEKQNQVKLNTENKVLVNQTIQDFSGRPALNTMAAPLSQSYLGYKAGYIKKSDNTLYTASDFDADGNYKNPSTIANSPLTDYYSDNNPDPTIPNAQGYAYYRTLYFRDGTNRPKEQGSAGATHAIKTTGDKHTTRNSYSSVADKELVRIFGDEAPADSSVYKEITLDANNTATIAYISKEGQTIATCMSKPGSGLVDALSSQLPAGFTVQDEIKGNTQYGENCFTASKTVTFTALTALVLNYNINPATYQDECSNICQTCDYKVSFYVRDVETGILKYSNTVTINPSTCTAAPGITTVPPVTVSLEAGDYVIERRVEAANTNTGTGNKYIDEQATALTNQLQGLYDGTANGTTNDGYITNAAGTTGSISSTGKDMVTINNYIAAGNVDGLNTYLGISPTDNTTKQVYLKLGCDIIEIPVKRCPKPVCDPLPNFEQLLLDKWSAAYPGYTLHDFMPEYTTGQFNIVITNMLAYINPQTLLPYYTCEQLTNCWQGVVENYQNMSSLYSGVTQTNPGLLKSFLNCTGYHLKGCNTNGDINTLGGYKSEPYAYFYYTNNSNTICEQADFNSDITTIPHLVHSYQNNNLQTSADEWNNFYQCVSNMSATSGTNGDLTGNATTNEENCKKVCESRYESFLSALVSSYNEANLSVQGYPYQHYTNFSTDIGLNVIQDLVEPNKFSFNLNGAFGSPINPEFFSLSDKKNQYFFYNTDLGKFVDNSGSGDIFTLDLQTGIGTIIYVNVLPPENGPNPNAHYHGTVPVGPDISSSQLYCQARMLEGQCESKCHLTITSHVNGSGNTVIDQVGTPAEHQSMKEAMTYDFELAIPDGSGNCAAGFTKVQSSESRNGLLQDYLNQELNNFRDNMGINGGTFNYLDKLLAFNPALNSLSCYNTMVATPTLTVQKNETSEFSLEQGVGGGVIITSGTYQGSSMNTSFPNGTPVEVNAVWLLPNQIALGSIFSATLTMVLTGSSSYSVSPILIYPVAPFTLPNNASSVMFLPASNNSAQWSATQVINFVAPATSPEGNNYVGFGVAGGAFILNSGASQISFGLPLAYLVGAVPPPCSPFQYTTHPGNEVKEILKVPTINLNYIVKHTVPKAIEPGSEFEVTMKLIVNKNNPSSLNRYQIKDELLNGFTLVSGSLILDATNQPITPGAIYTNTYKLRAPSISTINDFRFADTYYYHVNFGGPASFSMLDNTNNTINVAAPVTNTLCTTFCDQTSACGAVCLKWTTPGLPDPVTNPELYTDVTPVSCDQMSANYIKNYIAGQLSNFTTNHVAALRQSYKDNCINSAKLLDHFTAGYSLGYYHYTLYYYDRAGNLIKTVPPNGVIENDAYTRTTHPPHRFVTEYEVNSLKQIVRQKSPDGGETQFWYNNLGQLRFSQNSKQLAMGNQTYSYSKYDPLGRIIQVGQVSNADVAQVNIPAYPTSGITQVTSTGYTYPLMGGVSLSGRPQRYLQNRVSFTAVDNNYTFFSYDPYGNVEWMINSQPVIGQTTVAYEYDLISGSMLKVKYNEGKADQFFHRYMYDADKRIKTVETSRDGYLWDNDARYNYYAHGPLKRTELGEDSIQGIDYVYTIQGWLKGINHSSLDNTLDPSHDGLVTTPHANTAKDVYGSILTYFSGDFNRTVAGVQSKYNSVAATTNQYHLQGDDLFNGNISTWTSRIGFKDIVAPAGSYKYDDLLTGNVYRYDELNRLKKSTFRTYNTGSNAFVANTNNEYNEEFTYDANGNLKTLKRNSYYNTDPGVLNADMDNFTYNYLLNTNKLSRVDDGISLNTYQTDDIKNGQTGANYTYDSIGNLISDAAGKISNIEWNVYGKIKTVTLVAANGTTVVKTINYFYDAAGRRVRKEVITPSGTDKTYYALDATGNQLAVYTQTGTGAITMKEQPIYGMERIGTNTKSTTVNTTAISGSGTPVLTNTIPGGEKDVESPIYVPVTAAVNFPFLGLVAFSGAKQLITTPASPSNNNFSLYGGNALYNGMIFSRQGRGVASVIDPITGASILRASCIKGQGSAPGDNEICLLYDQNNLLLSASANIPAGVNTQCAFAKVPGDNDRYYLFTIKDAKAYCTLINLTTKTVEKPPIVIIDLSVYGSVHCNTMKVLENRTVNTSPKGQLYLHANVIGNNFIGAFDINPLTPTNDPSMGGLKIMTSFPSNATNNDGEMEISPDGKEMMIANNTGSYTVISGQIVSGKVTGELRRFKIADNHIDQFKAADGGKSILTFPDLLISSLAYNSAGTKIFSKMNVLFWGAKVDFVYSTDNQLNKTSENYYLFTQGILGDVRRGVNNNIYVPTGGVNSKTMNVITPAGVTTTLDASVNAGTTPLTGYMPLYNHIVISPITYTTLGTSQPITGRVYTRTLDGKTYELKNHLGSVVVTVSDIKLWAQSVADGGNGDNLPDGGEFRADVKSYTNYYAFGSVQPKRAYYGTPGSRGFGNQEKDDEIYGIGNAYTAEYWEYDPRLGRRWNVDPVVKPWESPYAAFSNNPIYYVDPNGADATAVWEAIRNAGKAVAAEVKKVADRVWNGKLNHPKFGLAERSGGGLKNFFKNAGKFFGKVGRSIGRAANWTVSKLANAARKGDALVGRSFGVMFIGAEVETADWKNAPTYVAIMPKYILYIDFETLELFQKRATTVNPIQRKFPSKDQNQQAEQREDDPVGKYNETYPEPANKPAQQVQTNKDVGNNVKKGVENAHKMVTMSVKSYKTYTLDGTKYVSPTVYEIQVPATDYNRRISESVTPSYEDYDFKGTK